MVCLNKWSKEGVDDFRHKYVENGFNEDIALRTYSSRLLGSDPELVLHGGGNTSVKTNYKDLFGNNHPVLCVKGSGWDLATIEPEGHPMVYLNPLLKLKKLNVLSDEDMVAVQRQNLINPKSPNPSVETLLHAFLPHKFIDHTHSIALLSVADQYNSEDICKKIYGNEVAIVPYIMPGFDLAKLASEIHDEAEKKAKSTSVELKGMVLLKHGIFSFGKTAEESYLRMIELVNKAEKFLTRKIELDLSLPRKYDSNMKNLDEFIPCLRGLISKKISKYSNQKRCVFDIRSSKNIIEFSDLQNIQELSERGVATPDHVIRTKAKPLILKNLPSNLLKQKCERVLIDQWLDDANMKLDKYIEEYINYFDKNNLAKGNVKKRLDPLPRILIIPGFGLIGIGDCKKSASMVADISQTWIETLLSAESIGKYCPVSSEDTFDLEYWSLEQAKLGKKKLPPLAGNIVCVTGAGGVIGLEIAKEFYKNGAEIICLDKDYNAAKKSAEICGENALAISCDVTTKNHISNAFNEIIFTFGGIDILISNAGSAIQGNMYEIEDAQFESSLKINLLAHHYLSQKTLKIFKSQDYINHNKSQNLGGQLLFNVSKQALNPGKGFGAYGIAKSALLALMKQYAIEEGKFNIRSNCVNADRIRSGLLNTEMIRSRSIARGITEDEYMSGNLLRSEVRAKDVANAFLSLSLMERTTGAIVTVDGGNVAAMPR